MTTYKTAVVTGANKGLGFSIVKLLCQKYDGKVYLTSRDVIRGKKACEDLKKIGLNPTFHQLDVANQDSVNGFMRSIKNNKEEVDILINNAGILFLKDATEPKVYQAEQTLFVNFFSLVNFTEAILPYLKNGARIVNISSSSGHLSRIPSESLRKIIKSDDLSLDRLKELMKRYVAAVNEGVDLEEGWGESPYVVSKVGVNCYTFMLHRRLSSRGILVNCFHPGYVISDMTRGVGSVRPEDAAETAIELALHSTSGGQYVWWDGTTVPWDGPDPRSWIDGKK